MKLQSSKVFLDAAFVPACLVIKQGKIVEIREQMPASTRDLLDLGEKMIFPGLVDTHVHINEPGRTEWEGFETATQAAAAGGITTLIDMPLNCVPPTTSRAALAEKLKALRQKLFVDCGFWGGVTPDSLEELPALLEAGVLGVKSFLIESGVEEFPQVSFADVERAMPILKQAGLPYLFHAEWTDGGAVASSDAFHSYVEFEASRPASWEEGAIRKLIALCARYECRTHIVHLSASSALPLIRDAKANGLPLSVETCPHYLCFHSSGIDQIPDQQKALFKCCPPIRSARNCDELWQAVKDGTIDFIVSDHSPCTLDLKCLDTGDLDKAWGGIMGLQAGFLAVVTEGAKRGVSLAELLPKFTSSPARFVGLEEQKGVFKKGADADIVVYDEAKATQFDTKGLYQKNKASPYNGMNLDGQILQTYLRGELIFDRLTGFSLPRGRTIGVKI